MRRLASRALSTASIPVRSPRDGQVFAEIADWSAGEVDAAVAAAKGAAASAWAKPDAVGVRSASLRALATAIRRDTPRLADLEARDCGKPIAEAEADMGACADLFDFYAEIAPAELAPVPLALPDAEFASRVVAYPMGIAACVTPWNYPLMQAVCKVAPALAAGCATLLKPSPLASLTCLEMGKLAAAEAGLPDGALTVLTGGPPDGASDGASRLLAHPSVDFLSFTGSTRGGVEMLNASAPLVRPSGLELGGKGAMLVFDDADLASVVDWAMVGIFVTSGQICSATSRLLVHASKKSELLEALHAKALAIKLGDPLEASTQMGAVISAESASRILAIVQVGGRRCTRARPPARQPPPAPRSLSRTRSLSSARPSASFRPDRRIMTPLTTTPLALFRALSRASPGAQQAQADGSTLLCGGGDGKGGGGSIPDELAGGYYVQPTILTDVPLASAAWREEIFGPVLCVQTFETEADAVALANDSPYGLAHAVMSSDAARCERVAAQLEAGTVWMNCNQPLWPVTPFGGWKASGFGKEWGAAGMHEYLRHKTVTGAVQPGYSWAYYG